MKAATDRESQLAVRSCAAPHLTHTQLIEKHAKLKAQAAAHASQGNPPAAYSFGARLGKKRAATGET
jgi:hypothetical protein